MVQKLVGLQFKKMSTRDDDLLLAERTCTSNNVETHSSLPNGLEIVPIANISDISVGGRFAKRLVDIHHQKLQHCVQINDLT